MKKKLALTLSAFSLAVFPSCLPYKKPPKTVKPVKVQSQEIKIGKYRKEMEQDFDQFLQKGFEIQKGNLDVKPIE